MNKTEIERAIRFFEGWMKYWEGKSGLPKDYQRLMKAKDTAMSALRDALQRQPDPDTGLVPCGWCGPERIGWFSVQFWVRASTGKRKWMSVTQKYKGRVKFCPMCGRKLEGRQ